MTVTLQSNLELHIGVLQTLAHHGSIYSNNIEAATNMDRFTLKRSLEFLIRNRFVEERPVDRNHVFYFITERGQEILDIFQKITDVLKIDCKPPKNEVLIDEN